MTQETRFSCLLVGNEFLAAECGRMLLEAGHEIRAVVTRKAEVRSWAEDAGLQVLGGLDALQAAAPRADWLISAANLDLLAPEHLALAGKGAINFHDGPLPRYAGLNAPVWALLAGEARHGVTWHRIAEGIDEGAIIAAKTFDVAETDTALTLNARCFSAGIECFPDVITSLEADLAGARPQDLADRSYFAKNARPEAGGLIDLATPAGDILRLMRALDHGAYWNPLSVPKLLIGADTFLVRTAEAAEGDAAPGEVLSVTKDSITLGTASHCLRFSGLTDMMGAPRMPRLVPGDVIPAPRDKPALQAALKDAIPGENRWIRAFSAYAPALWCTATGEAGEASETVEGNPETLAQAFAAIVAVVSGGDPVDLALADPGATPGVTLPWRPVRFEADQPWGAASSAFSAALTAAADAPGIAADLPARLVEITQRRLPDAALSDDGPLPGAALTLERTATGARLHADLSRISRAELDLFAARLGHLAGELTSVAEETPISRLPLLPEAEKTLLLQTWNDTGADFAETTCIHQKTCHARS